MRIFRTIIDRSGPSPKQPKRPAKPALRDQRVERLNGLSRSMWRDLKSMGEGGRCKGCHIGMMAKMGLCVKVGQIYPRHGHYVLTDAGKAKLTEYPESLRAERARYAMEP